MVHTLPDGTTKYKMVTLFGQIDSGELAARLNSISNFDRRGNVILLDDFEAAILKWENNGAGTGNVQAVSTGAAKNGSQSCILTAGEGAGGQAYIYKYLGVPVSGKLGAEFSFTIDADTKDISIDFRWLDGAKFYRALIQYITADDKFQYVNSDGNPVDLLTSIPLRESIRTFNTLKIVIDTDPLEFVRFMINNQTVDMSGLGLYPDTDTTAASIYLGITHTSAHASVKSIYIDNIIITQNEP